MSPERRRWGTGKHPYRPGPYRIISGCRARIRYVMERTNFKFMRSVIRM